MLDFSEAAIGGVLGTVFDHIRDNGRERTSVITISWGAKQPINDPLSRLWREFVSDCGKFESISIPIFVAAGNFAYTPSRKMIDTVPALFYRRLRNVFALGNCDNYGFRYKSSQTHANWGFHTQSIYAPGVDVVCPVPGYHTGLLSVSAPKLSRYTAHRASSWKSLIAYHSIAAPVVAGVIADILASDTLGHIDSLEKLMHFASWERTENGVDVLSNNVPYRNNPPSKSPPKDGLSIFTNTMSNNDTTTRNNVDFQPEVEAKCTSVLVGMRRIRAIRRITYYLESTWNSGRVRFCILVLCTAVYSYITPRDSPLVETSRSRLFYSYSIVECYPLFNRA